MISIVCPVWRKQRYEAVAVPWIMGQVERYGAELIEVSGDSIFEAHEIGRQRAKHDLVVYVHDDVRLIEPLNLAPQIVAAFEDNPKLGLIGPVGKGGDSTRVPWWTNPGPHVGHYLRRDGERLIYGYGHDGKPRSEVFKQRIWDEWAHAQFVDGFCLIEHRGRVDVPWDIETYPGHWHGYDIDRCMQVRELGFDVMVGPWLWLHDNGGHAGYKGTDPSVKPTKDNLGRKAETEGDVLWLQHLDEVNCLFRQKWGAP